MHNTSKIGPSIQSIKYSELYYSKMSMCLVNVNINFFNQNSSSDDIVSKEKGINL